MEEYRNPIILTFVGLYMFLCVIIGIWALRRTKSTHDFFMAGRDLGIMVTAFAVFSSIMSGFGFVGGPGLVYRMGMSSVWMFVCIIMGFNLAFFLLAKRLRLLSEIGNAVSLPDIVALRYQNNYTRFSDSGSKCNYLKKREKKIAEKINFPAILKKIKVCLKL